MIYVAGRETEEDFLRMQQEAIRRVREMQSRARRTLEEKGMHIESNKENEQPHDENIINRSAVNSSMPNVQYPHPSAATSLPYGKNPSGSQPENKNSSQNARQTSNNQNGFQNPFASLFGNMGQNSGNNASQNQKNTNVQNINDNNSGEKNQNPKSGFNGFGGDNNSEGETEKKPPESSNNAFEGFFPGGLPIPLSGLNINLDKDQLMLMGMLYVLFKDGGDKWLMLALAYILFT